MSKKNLYIILIVIGSLILIGGLAWYFLLRPKETLPLGADFTVNGGPIVSESKLKAISNGPAVAARSSGGTLLFYDFSGQLWQIPLGTTAPVTASQANIDNPADVVWSLDLKNIVKSGSEQADAKFIFSDFTKKTLVNLKSGIKSLSFSPDGKKIAYYVFENLKNNSLFTSDPDGRNQKTLFSSLKLRDVVLAWPKINQISLTTKPSGLIPGGVWTLDTRNLVLAKVVGNFNGLETLWAPDGNGFIYSFTDQNGYNPKLAIYNKKGEKKDLGGISTVIDKCVWANDSINVFCAVPENWPEGMILPDDYYKRADLTVDNVWKINTETEEKRLLASGLGDIKNLMIDESESSLFFILRSDQVLYELNLK
ncbi:MAG: hypothetical protein Q7K16_01395 [Candidatus Azambacteria bacterium]|nr:hypothetical protein [Candidatus Azambacteria bacterium]